MAPSRQVQPEARDSPLLEKWGYRNRHLRRETPQDEVGGVQGNKTAALEENREKIRSSAVVAMFTSASRP